MGIVKLTYRPTEKSIGGFVIDAFLSESYQFTNEVTDVPVEEGVNIADHVVEKADVIQVSAFIGRTEFTAYDGDVPDNLQDLSNLDTRTRIIKAYQELRRMKSAKLPVTVVLGLGTFKNMIITSFNIGRDAETGADLSFDMTLNELKVVRSQSVEISASQIAQNTSATDQAAGTSNMGTAAKEESPYGSDIWVSANANVDAMGISGSYVEGIR
jgi:hypothetical protein